MNNQQSIGPLDLIARDRRRLKVKPRVFKTPGRECAHATSGACPHCMGDTLGYMRSPLADNTHAGRI